METLAQWTCAGGLHGYKTHWLRVLEGWHQSYTPIQTSTREMHIFCSWNSSQPPTRPYISSSTKTDWLRLECECTCPWKHACGDLSRCQWVGCVFSHVHGVVCGTAGGGGTWSSVSSVVWSKCYDKCLSCYNKMFLDLTNSIFLLLQR